MTTFDKKSDETIRKKVKKSDFFGIFWDFSDFFRTDFLKMDNFWITLDNFWTTL
jgi:predicted AAA+ superfamily ATPase